MSILRTSLRTQFMTNLLLLYAVIYDLISLVKIITRYYYYYYYYYYY